MIRRSPRKPDSHLRIDLVAFVNSIYATTNCICGLKRKLKGTGFDVTLECTKCRAGLLLKRAKPC